jgi:signal transduction histidine kinase
VSQPIEIHSAWTPQLRRAFGFIILGILLSGIVSLYVMHHLQNEVESIEDRSIARIRMVFRLSEAIEIRRRLFDDHIVETSIPGMDRIEVKIRAVDTSIADIAQRYQPTISDPAERDEWQKLQAEIVKVEPEAEKALALSRQNRDLQARTTMNALDPQFDAIGQTMDDLVRLNTARAAQQLRQLHALHRIATVILASLIAGLTVFAFFVARWVTRIIRQGENELRAANAQLEERNRELDSFAGRVAHDLRGPLTAINLAAVAPDRASRENVNAVFRRGVKRMEVIIEDLLTLSRIGAQTERAMCDASAVAASIEEDLRSKVEALGGVLHVEAATATVPCSEGLLRQVLWNLGENSVKYRRPGVQLAIEIRGRALPHAYEFSVSDNGNGMSPSEARRAFEPFFRGEQVRETPGTGLGLSIVKRVVEASGGSVSVDSAIGKGTTFKVRLPLAADKAA